MDTIYDAKLLIVDDNADLLALLCEQLRGAGYGHIRTTQSCAAARACFAAEQPELMILDINLPDGDGFSLFRALRAKADVPALFLSARDADADRLFGLGLGADDYLTKPFGTVHALLCAADVVHEPFCVINADDYYGIDAYRTIYDELVKLPETGKATMVGYLLKNTASLHGTVSRGVCAVEDGKLRSVREALKIQLYPDGTLRDLAEGTDLSPESVVSMNFWGFAPRIFHALREYFENFLRTEAGENIKAECLLPVMVGDQLQKGALEVSVLHSADKWFGMTYHEDREIVAEELRKLHARGDYPESLRV